MAQDALWSNVTVLTKFEEAFIPDQLGSDSGFWQASGSVSISTSRPKFGAQAGEIANASAYWAFSTTAPVVFGSGNFVVEASIIVDDLSAARTVLSYCSTAGTTNSHQAWRITLSTGGVLSGRAYAGGTEYVVNHQTALATGTNYETAFERIGDKLYLYVNGVVCTTPATLPSSGTSLTNPSSSVFRMGKEANRAQGFVGRIDELRITKGASRYGGANYTPSTVSFATSGPLEIASADSPVFGDIEKVLASNTISSANSPSFGVMVALHRRLATLDVSYELEPPRIQSYLDVAYDAGRLYGYWDTAYRTLLQSYYEASYKYRERLYSRLDVGYRVGTPLVGRFDLAFHLHTRLVGSWDTGYATAMVGFFDVASTLRDELHSTHDVASSFTNPVVGTCDFSYAILDHIPLKGYFDFSHIALTSSTVIESTAPILQVDSENVNVVQVSLSTDEGSPVWEAVCELANPYDISKFPISKEFTVIFLGEVYKLIVDNRALSRQEIAPGQLEVRATIYGRSPLVKYAAPRADLIDKTWESAVTAADLAEELIPGIAWGIIDWTIPAGVFGVENASPYEALSRVAAAAGGLIESLPDGTIHVRYKFPDSVPAWGPATASHTVTDKLDNFSLSEKYSAIKLVDLLTINNRDDSAAQDRAEWVADEGGDPDRGILKVYPYEWRHHVTIQPTGPVKWQYSGAVTRTEEDEIVQFTDSKASTRFPVVSINSVTWLTRNLGGVTPKEYSTELTSSVSHGYSLAKITYTTRSHDFPMQKDGQSEVLILVEE